MCPCAKENGVTDTIIVENVSNGYEEGRTGLSL